MFFSDSARLLKQMAIARLLSLHRDTKLGKCPPTVSLSKIFSTEHWCLQMYDGLSVFEMEDFSRKGSLLHSVSVDSTHSLPGYRMSQWSSESTEDLRYIVQPMRTASEVSAVSYLHAVNSSSTHSQLNVKRNRFKNSGKSSQMSSKLEHIQE